ncbi:MAG: hypothetical protein ACQEVA_12580 [Myxococcota bacterium]
MGQTGELVITEDDLQSTLQGLGPTVEFEELELRLQPHLSGEVERRGEDWFVEIMRAQRERYEWFAAQVSPMISIEAHIQSLVDDSRGPGATELALVSLSISGETMARAVLNAWQPPEHDLELSLFHQICVAEAFRE